MARLASVQSKSDLNVEPIDELLVENQIALLRFGQQMASIDVRSG